jgi:phosphogluconate dehydratase
MVAIVRFQGPKANGMPELHSLTPALTGLQNKGFRVALVTDGRMSGASGAIPAAIHVCPGADDGGPLARIQDGDVVLVDAETGQLDLKVEASVMAARRPAPKPADESGYGRELFAPFRAMALDPERGGGVFRDLAMGTVAKAGAGV